MAPRRATAPERPRERRSAGPSRRRRPSASSSRRPEPRAGTRVRAGDRLGAVDMLGVAQEVVAPVDGLVGASLVEAGEAVEYGQELVVHRARRRGRPPVQAPGREA